jgi:hypothetical protein
MTTSWTLQRTAETPTQEAGETSFIGGRPALPDYCELPRCRLCGAEETFFLQVAFPDQHPWSGRTLAIFACTSCADEEHLIPEMLDGPLAGADIPAGFPADYQKNFRLLVFPTSDARLRGDYTERVRFAPFRLTPSDDDALNKLGGTPLWLLDDESPGKYAGEHEMRFLMQLAPDTRFPIHPDAPRQVELNLRRQPVPSPNDYYQLFLGNGLYLFGTDDGVEPHVYAITQID